jgi:hypothetical protein
VHGLDVAVLTVVEKAVGVFGNDDMAVGHLYIAQYRTKKHTKFVVQTKRLHTFFLFLRCFNVIVYFFHTFCKRPGIL